MPLYKVQRLKFEASFWLLVFGSTIWLKFGYDVRLCTCIFWRKWLVKPDFTVHQTSHLYYSDELKWQNLKVCLLLHVSCAFKLNTWFIITNKMIESDTNYWMETIIFSVSYNWGTTKVKFVKLEFYLVPYIISKSHM
jgi:hypothetical protein